MNRTCLGCRCTIAKGSRCGPCERQRKGDPAQRGYNAAWTALSRRMRAEWVAENGWNCPGWGTDGWHESHDLVLDHGDQDTGPQVMCRHHNGVKAATFDRNSQAPKGGARPVPA